MVAVCIGLGILHSLVCSVVNPTSLIPVPGPPVGMLFPEVRTTSVRLIWQPPAAPNGIILGRWELLWLCHDALQRDSESLWEPGAIWERQRPAPCHPLASQSLLPPHQQAPPQT